MNGMTFEQLKEILTQGLSDNVFKISLEGYIKSCKMQGQSPQEVLDKVNSIFMKEQ